VFLLHGDLDSIDDSTSIEEIASRYADEVLRLAPDSPVILGGYCWGGLAAWHLAHLLRSRGVVVLELLLIDALSLNARPLLRGLGKLFDTAGAIVPGRPGRFLRQRAMRGVRMWVKGQGTFGTTLYRGAQKMLFDTMSADSPRANGADMKRHLNRMVSRYVPPGIDVDVTCFIAEKGTHFNIDPSFWHKLARTVNAVSVPGTHSGILVERESLAKALAAALKEAQARYAS
jgi:thioesterase domain-containing protein